MVISSHTDCILYDLIFMEVIWSRRPISVDEMSSLIDLFVPKKVCLFFYFHFSTNLSNNKRYMTSTLL